MTRIERDSLGEVEVPEDAYYGSFTVRAIENFDLSGEYPPRELIRTLGQIKYAAAQVNEDIGDLDRKKAESIKAAADEVASGDHDNQFPTDFIQAGAGTPLHMNANEVIANRATELLGGRKGQYLIHPNDHVNMGQSSNNVVPTAIRLVLLELSVSLSSELKRLGDTFKNKGDKFSNLLKVGRTHYQDAVPITLGQEFEAYATICRRAVDNISEKTKVLSVVGLGGNAVGTGINTAQDFRERLVKELVTVTGADLTPAEDPIALTQSMRPFQEFSGSLRETASDLLKVTNDLMFLSSGPVAGINEINLPEVEPGSSIMPGKVNPSIVEAVKMSLIQVLGCDHTVSLATREGHLELNTMAPLIGKNLISAVQLFSKAMKTFREKCIEGIQANKEAIEKSLDKSTAVATALSPYLGYDRVTELVKECLEKDNEIRELVLERGWFTKEELERVLAPERLTSPQKVDPQLREKVDRRLKDNF